MSARLTNNQQVMNAVDGKGVKSMGTQEKEESVTILRKAYRCLYIRLLVLKYALHWRRIISA